MHNTNNKCTDDVAVARPVENAEECATSLAAADNKKGSQVHKSLSTDNRDITIARPKTSGPKKKAIKRAKHSTDSAVLHTKGKEMKDQMTEVIRYLHPRLYCMTLMLKGVK